MTTSLWTGARRALSLDPLALGDWFHANGLDPSVQILEGPDVPAGVITPTLVVTFTTGPGDATEEYGTRWVGFQIRSVGATRNPATARDLADGADTVLTADGDQWPASIGTVIVHAVTLTGGTPSVDRIDTAYRTHYVGNYLAMVSTDPNAQP